MTTITRLSVRDIRFPTSRSLDGSDAMNAAPDYSAAYVMLETDSTQGFIGTDSPSRSGAATKSASVPCRRWRR